MVRFLTFLLMASVALTSQALTFRVPPDGDSLVGQRRFIQSQPEYTFNIIGEAYGVGFRELIAANPGINPWVPGDNEILIPAEYILPEGQPNEIVLNLAELRLYYFLEDGETVLSYAIGIGREGRETPIMETEVRAVVHRPSWTPPKSIRAEYEAAGRSLPAVVPPGPDNPMGEYAIQLGVPSYFLHGTNQPVGIGMRASSGCIRMWDDDIHELAHRVKRGTKVRVINQPFKAGFHRGRLYLEAHEGLEEYRNEENPLEGFREEVERAIQQRPEFANRVDWKKAEQAALVKAGLPVDITLD